MVSEPPTSQDTSPAPAPQAPPVQEASLQIPEALEVILARAISQSLAQCLQHGGISAEGAASPQYSQRPRDMEDHFSDQNLAGSPTSADQESLSEADEVPEAALSDDEGLLPDQSPFIGLFRPQMFGSLLFKAIVTTQLGEVPSSSTAHSSLDPASALFAEPTIDPETIPAPKLFLDVLHRQWSLPGTGPSPNSLDKRLYNSAAALSDLLQPPTIDPPIVALSNPVHLTGPPEDSLRPEDKRAKKTLIKGHQAAAWSIRASTSTSFFN